jgi:5-formyltetrahydrofolate cyclo-ligase
LTRSRFPVALPAIRDSLILAFRAYTPGEPLVPVRFQLHEPPETASAVIPQILLVPLLAFDRTGARLGYGGGYYDATLRHLRASGRNVVAVGAAFDEQEMPALPFEPHDERLDYILTPSRLIRLGA